ncbi:hypothetical protein Daura_44435 [Dactylosporangium aurantiacum]|uniref:UspA domain-containing protein n=1 Tax=Dactylosporangium aurantiacum TaxID=35754 RepID=A0A9Q9IDT6_9ACTN|nr:hypothetical protein [Dactylosporangium aurantiacum]MDG6102170.1 hypothetical protein [Dactylosporangium aurantiacum]UWZ53511.1 hypothetical protein Daura_44435 [Dactylosporangium aurantiacum]
MSAVLRSLRLLLAVDGSVSAACAALVRAAGPVMHFVVHVSERGGLGGGGHHGCWSGCLAVGVFAGVVLAVGAAKALVVMRSASMTPEMSKALAMVGRLLLVVPAVTAPLCLLLVGAAAASAAGRCAGCWSCGPGTSAAVWGRRNEPAAATPLCC